MDNETRVLYKAIADFTQLTRGARAAKKEIRDLRNEEAKLNSQSIRGAAAQAMATQNVAKSQKDVTEAYSASTTASGRARKSFRDSAVEAMNAAAATKKVADSSNEAAQAQSNLADMTRKAYREMLAAKGATEGAAEAQKSLEGVTRRAYRTMQEQARANTTSARAMRAAHTEGTKLNSLFQRIGNWRPRLTPPFVALIPIIAAVIGLINPLVAGLGAVGAAAIGFASSLGQVAAGAIAVVPALTTLLSIVTALKVGFGGIGNAFKAFGKMKEATGGGGGSTAQRAELSQTEELTRAQDRYARAIQNVAWAQEDLDDARRDYVKRLRELQQAVDRAAMSEARAAANSQLARENYANVLADPGSTKGQKMDAKVGVEEAGAEFTDVVQENKQNIADLNRMKREGMEGDRQVIQAQRALTDAIYAQRDAQLDLINTQSGANKTASAAATATDEYAAALAKLSPSARRFVENLISMNDEWTALKRNVQESFFSEVADDVLKLRDLFPSLEYLLSKTAGALGRVASGWIDLVTSPEWRRDFMLIGDQNVPVIENVGDGLGSLATAFKDLAIAAGPFLESLSVGFKDGADNLERLVAGARGDGSLASYLEGVREKMSQWWRIVKNIGKTLFNYSAAASDFGDWLTDGFEKVTEGWLKSSQEARKEGSPFKEFLEDVKPLLSEVKGLFADFFGWFAEEASDDTNITMFTDIVKAIRDDLGPAVAEFLDKVSESGVGKAFVEALTTITEIVTELANSGALQTFFGVLNTILDFLKFVVGIPGVGAILSAIATGFAAIAAVTFVGKFTGITNLIGWLLKLSKGGKGLPGLLSKIAGGIGLLGAGGGAAGAAGAAAGGTAVAAGTTRKQYRQQAGIKPPRMRGGGIAGIIGTLGLSLLPGLLGGGGGGDQSGGGVAPAVTPGMSRREYRASAGSAGGKGLDAMATFGKTVKSGADAGKGFNLMGSIAKGAGRGAGLGAVASIAGTVAGDLIASGAASGKEGSGQRVGGNMVAGAASGAGLGALIGSFIPIPGVGTGVGAAVGGAIGAGVGFATSSDEDKAAVMEDIGNWFTQELPRWIGDVANGFRQWLTVDLPAWLASIWQGFNTWLTVELPAWLASIGQGFYTWLTVDLPFALGMAAGLFWKWLTVDMPAWLATVWNGFMTWLTVDLPRWIAQAWQRFLTWLTVDLPRWVEQAARDFWNFLTVDLPAWIAQAAADFWQWLTVDLPKSVVDAGKAIGDGFVKFFEDFFSGTGKFFAGIGKAWNDWWGNLFSGFNFGFGGGNDEDGKPGGDVPPGMRRGPTVNKVSSLMGGTGLRITNTFRTPEQNRESGGSSRSLHMDPMNPAMDIAGPIPAMNSFARLLGMIGGWRQLYYNNINAPGVGHWPGHSDHIHVARNGGKVPGSGNGDIVPSMLTPGEFVVRKSIVNRVGPENLSRFNSGVMSYQDLLKKGMSESEKNKDKKKGYEHGLGSDDISFFNAGGLVPGGYTPGGGDGVTPPPGANFGGGNFPPQAPIETGAPVIGGDLIVKNARPERASESIPSAIRQVAYLGGKRDD